MPHHGYEGNIDQLAEQARQILKVPTRADAIRQALERVVESEKSQQVVLTKSVLKERLDTLRREFRLPPNASLPPFDEKAFLDDMWGEDDVPR